MSEHCMPFNKPCFDVKSEHCLPINKQDFIDMIEHVLFFSAHIGNVAIRLVEFVVTIGCLKLASGL